MSIAETAFNAAATAFPEALCKLRRERETIETALCVVQSEGQGLDENGTFAVTDAAVRYLKTADMNPAIKQGDVVDMMRTGNGDTEWKTYRVGMVTTPPGLVRLMLKMEFE